MGRRGSGRDSAEGDGPTFRVSPWRATKKVRKPPTAEQQLEFARLRAFITVATEDILASLPLLPSHRNITPPLLRTACGCILRRWLCAAFALPRQMPSRCCKISMDPS
jgi:hypothetical protein